MKNIKIKKNTLEERSRKLYQASSELIYCMYGSIIGILSHDIYNGVIYMIYMKPRIFF